MAQNMNRWLIMVFLPTAFASTYTEKDALMTDLLNNYNLDLRPLENQTETMDISMNINVYGITDIDPVKGSITLTASYSCRWIDEIMTWNATQYNGIISMMFQQKQVWVPSITLATSLHLTVIGEQKKDRVKFMSNGEALWQPAHVTTQVCTFYMKFWPFDKQICTVVLVLQEPINEVKFEIQNQGVDTSRVMMSEWVLEDTIILKQEASFVSTQSFQFKFKRQPDFYNLTLILPIALIGFLISFVFILPSDAGERIGFSITIMLSLAVFLTVIAEEIPRTTNPVAWICGFVMMLTLTSVIVTILTIINLQLYHRSDKQTIGTFWKTICRWRRFRCTKNKIRSDNQAVNTNDALSNAGDPKHEMKRVEIANIDKTLNIEGDKLCLEQDQHSTENEYSWHDVSKSVDDILFIITFVSVTIPTIVFLCYLSMASDYYDIL